MKNIKDFLGFINESAESIGKFSSHAIQEFTRKGFTKLNDMTYKHQKTGITVKYKEFTINGKKYDGFAVNGKDGKLIYEGASDDCWEWWEIFDPNKLGKGNISQFMDRDVILSFL